jgi:hypothetical protein
MNRNWQKPDYSRPVIPARIGENEPVSDASGKISENKTPAMRSSFELALWKLSQQQAAEV